MLTQLKQKKGVALAVTTILMIWVFLVLATLVNYTVNNSNTTNLYAANLNTKIQLDQIATDYANISNFKSYYLLELNYTQDAEDENLIANNKFKININDAQKTLTINNINNDNLLTAIFKEEGGIWVVKSWNYNPAII